MHHRLRDSEAFVAGVSAMLVPTALLAVGHLVQAGMPFPPFGLAQRLLAVVPGPVAVFFVERLGHWALRLFTAGFTVGSVLAGGAGGVLVARRPRGRWWPFAWGAGGLLALAALFGYAAQPGAPSFATYLALVALAAALYVTGLVRGLQRLDRDPVPTPARGLGRTRRQFLRALAGAAGLLAVGFGARRMLGGLGDHGGTPLARPAAAPLRPAAPPPAGPDDAAFAAIKGLTGEVTPNRLHYTVDESIIDPSIDARSWTLRIDGHVDAPTSLGYADLLAMPAVEQYVTLQCISNFVGGDLVSTAKWTGVPLADVLARAGGITTGAVRVVFHAVGGYSDSLPVAKALERSTIVAYGMNGLALPRAHGYPARIIAPGIYGMKNVKWVERIEVVDYDYQGYWQRSDGWDNIAEIKTASRIDVPAAGDVVKGEGVIAGLAWAGTRRIEGVEVSVDGGRSWAAAILRRELAPAAWRQWRLPWRPGAAGRAVLQVRAIDGRGQVQTGEVAPPHPSGASGYDLVEIHTDPTA